MAGKLYGRERWQRLRKHQLLIEPLAASASNKAVLSPRPSPTTSCRTEVIPTRSGSVSFNRSAHPATIG